MFHIDLHIHSALSACAEDIMGIKEIMLKAQERNLNVLAITDHNASGNIKSAQKLADDFGIRLIPGIEISTREDVHILAYFNAIEELFDLQELIDHSLPDVENLTDFYGYQLLYDELGEIVDIDNKMRQIGTSLGLDDLVGEIHTRNGVVIPAHVYRQKFSLTSQLGFIPPDSGFDAVEVRVSMWNKQSLQPGARLEGYPVITGSDAHFLEDVGRIYFELPIEVKTIEDVIHYIKQ